MTENPKVFISYSHDSPEHKRWVSELAAKLRHNGIDAMLDQWDLGLGDDITRFMERGIVNADRVLVICTDKYLSKANANEGGVGYERMIVNAELVQNLGTDKFIPIIRQTSEKEKTPTFLGTRVYADFSNDSQFDAESEKLIRDIHQTPIMEKPSLGKNPFPSIESDTQLIEIPEEVKSASEAYKIATKLARAGDALGWRKLVKEIRPRVFKNLVQWREDKLDGKEPKGKEQLIQVLDKAVDIVAPLMVVALAGVESGREQFKKQKSFLYDLINIIDWNSHGNRGRIRLSYALGYVYHSLHGCTGLSTNQIESSLGLARVRITDRYNSKKVIQVWEMGELVAWTRSLGPNYVESWNYLVNACDREGLEWLSTVFEGKTEYRSLLVAYYMALNIYELGVLINTNRSEKLNEKHSARGLFRFKVPLTFLSENQDIFERAQTILLRNPDAVTALWTMSNVTHEQMQNLWSRWVTSSEYWLEDVYRRSLDVRGSMRNIYKNVDRHQDFFQMVQL